MGGVDKGLQPLRGKPMVQWVLERLGPQVAEIIVNANQNPDEYRKFGYRVVADDIAGFAGPLAGLHAGLKAAAHPLVATVPCDSPFLPPDLLSPSDQFRFARTAFVIFIVAASTDWVDGFLARRWHATTRWGAILDPIADKILVLRDGAVEMWGPRDVILQQLRKANLPKDASKAEPQISPPEEPAAVPPNRLAAAAGSE